jgi:hypothetical protein
LKVLDPPELLLEIALAAQHAPAPQDPGHPLMKVLQP